MKILAIGVISLIGAVASAQNAPPPPTNPSLVPVYNNGVPVYQNGVPLYRNGNQVYLNGVPVYQNGGRYYPRNSVPLNGPAVVRPVLAPPPLVYAPAPVMQPPPMMVRPIVPMGIHPLAPMWIGAGNRFHHR